MRKSTRLVLRLRLETRPWSPRTSDTVEWIPVKNVGFNGGTSSEGKSMTPVIANT